MHRRRPRQPSDPPAGSIRVTVDVTVRRNGEEQPAHRDSSEHSDTSERPELPMATFTVGPPGRAVGLGVPSREGVEPIVSHADAILEAIARDAFQEDGMVIMFPEPPADLQLISMDEAERRSTALIDEIVFYGKRLGTSETLEAHAKSIPKDCDEEDSITPAVWMQRFGLVKESDQPLFFTLRDSLRSHTPVHILRRWDTLRRHLSERSLTIAGLIRQAEEMPKKKWTALIKEFYFLLLDHNEALVESASTLQPQFGSLELKLSALALAFRIYFYLWRMTRPNPTSCVQGYRRARRFAGIPKHLKEFYALIGQEFAYMQDPSFGHFQSTERALVGDPVHINSVTAPVIGEDLLFCSVCQDTHLATECVRPHNCQCFFGKSCLEPMLNRDFPFSNACPNCRIQLHAPLQWRPILSREERSMRAGLLWALRANAICLEREIAADPEPFTRGQKLRGFLRRVLYGRWIG